MPRARRAPRGRLLSALTVAAMVSGLLVLQPLPASAGMGMKAYAGTGTYGYPTAGAATSSKLANPQGLAMDSSGNLYIADTMSSAVLKVTAAGQLAFYAGNGQKGLPKAGAATSSPLSSPYGLALDSGGNLYIADYGNHCILKVTSAGQLSIFAGTCGTSGTPVAGPATSSKFNAPSAVAVDGSGNVYVADTNNNVVEKITSSGTLSILAGTGTAGTSTAGTATSSMLNYPMGLAVDSSGSVYISEYLGNRVDKVSAGSLSFYAGTGSAGIDSSTGTATSIRLSSPKSLWIDSSGNLYIACYQSRYIEKVTTAGQMSNVAVAGGLPAGLTGNKTTGDLFTSHGSPQYVVMRLYAPTAPDAPTVLVPYQLASGTALLAFTAPNDNGSAITGYTVTPYDVAAAKSLATQSCASSPCTVTGLTNGKSYTFTMTATNAIGTSSSSQASSSVVVAAKPNVPDGLKASPGNTVVSLAFTAPNDNGSAITGYSVTPYDVAAAQALSPQSCSSSPCTVTGLTNGKSYTFTMTATNAIGTSSASSPSVAVTPATVPDAPIALVATAGIASVSLAFTAPNGNGSAITSYTVTPYDVAAAKSLATQSCASSPCTVTGLTNGKSYTFTMTATNAVGAGTPSAASTAVTTPNVPAAPTALVVTVGKASASIAFTAPADNGSPITGYSVIPYDATTSQSQAAQACAASPCSITGLTNGDSYTFTMTATNAVGTGAPSTASTAVTPKDIPGVPTGLVASFGNGQVSLAFTAPSDNGSPITGYKVTPYDVAAKKKLTAVSCTASPCVIKGLTNGKSYTFTMTATNALGTTAASDPSLAATPATVPDAPTALAGTAGTQKVTLTWKAPANTGGSAVTGYIVYSGSGSKAVALFDAPITALKYTVTGLTSKTSYTYTVKAVNIAGMSVASTSVKVTAN